MSRTSRFRPSPGMIVACLALLVALGGASFAAVPAGPRATPPQAGDAYSTYHDDSVDVHARSRTLATLRIPQKGNYAIWAKAYFYKQSSEKQELGWVTCTLEAGGSDDTTDVALSNSELGGLVTHVVAALNGPASATLKCKAWFSYLRAQFIKITAIRVANLTITPA